MPAIAAVGSFLTSTAGATLASAALTTGATLYGQSQANNAAENALSAQQQATQQAQQFQQQQWQQTQQNQAPFLQGGYSALEALLGQLIPAYGASQQPDWDAYLQANPDVLEWAQKGGGDPSKPIEQQTLQQRAAYHYQNSGKAEGRQLKTISPTASQGPLTAPAPDFGTAPTAMEFGVGMGPPSALSYLQGYKESESYNVKKKATARDVNASYAAKGLLRSGAAINALSTKIEDLLAEDEAQWKQQQLQAFMGDLAGYNAKQRGYEVALGQYNANRNFTNSNYLNNRDFGYNSLWNLVGLGQNAAANVGNAGQNYANQASNLALNQGQNAANYAGQVGYNNALGANNIAGIWGNVLNNWSNPGTQAANGWGISAMPSPGYVPNFNPTPDFNHLLSLEG